MILTPESTRKMTDLVRKDHPMVAGFPPRKAPRKVIERRSEGRLTNRSGARC